MQTAGPLTSKDFRSPSILLSGTVDYDMYKAFRDQLGAAPAEGLITVELSTLGGDPEVARMMGEDIRFHSEVQPERRIIFLGKAAIYSAGTTFMSFFTKSNRYLTRGTRLMIHERKLCKTLASKDPDDLHRLARGRAQRDKDLDRDPERRVRKPDPRYRCDDGRGFATGTVELVHRGRRSKGAGPDRSGALGVA